MVSVQVSIKVSHILTRSFYIDTSGWSSTSTIDCCYTNSVQSVGIQSRHNGCYSIAIIDINSSIIPPAGSCYYTVTDYLSIMMETGHLLPLDCDAVESDSNR